MNEEKSDQTERISDESMQLWAEARAQVEVAQANLNFAQSFLVHRYALTGVDKVDAKTGEIIRDTTQ